MGTIDKKSSCQFYIAIFWICLLLWVWCSYISALLRSVSIGKKSGFSFLTFKAFSFLCLSESSHSSFLREEARKSKSKASILHFFCLFGDFYELIISLLLAGGEIPYLYRCVSFYLICLNMAYQYYFLTPYTIYRNHFFIFASAVLTINADIMVRRMHYYSLLGHVGC